MKKTCEATVVILNAIAWLIVGYGILSCFALVFGTAGVGLALFGAFGAAINQ